MVKIFAPGLPKLTPVPTLVVPLPSLTLIVPVVDGRVRVTSPATAAASISAYPDDDPFNLSAISYYFLVIY
jgi:hypothetical protein